MKMNKFLLAAAILGMALFFNGTVSAQKKKTTTAKKPAPTSTTTSTAAANAADVRAGADKTALQIKNVTKFIFLLGGIAQGIEDIDAQAKTGKVSKTTLDKNAQYKSNVIQSIRNLRAGLAALEEEFGLKNGLKIYQVRIQGVSGMAAVAEDQANGGKLTESGKTLLMVVEKLADTLAALP